MLNRIAQFFERRRLADGDSQPLPKAQKQLAAAALLVEVATTDNVFEPTELAAFKDIVAKTYELTGDEIEQLYDLARDRQQDATSLFQFTRLINDNCSREEKFTLVKSMWQIAYADGDLDKYEELIIRRVADLVYLSHTDFLVARNAARDA